jgi:hypothetical protein
MKFTCCICHEIVKLGEKDTYTIQVSQPAALSLASKPELLWAHRACLCKTIPVICEKLPD